MSFLNFTPTSHRKVCAFLALSIFTLLNNADGGTLGPLTYVKIKNSTAIAITDCDENANGAMVIPPTIEGLQVTHIWAEAFSQCEHLTSVDIPSNVVSIAEEAFSECHSLESVKMPVALDHIGSSSFRNCIALSAIEIPDSVTNIGYEAFSDCRSLTHVQLPEALSQLNGNVFSGCTRLSMVVIQQNITVIGGHPFPGCTNLKEVVFFGSAPPIVPTNSFADLHPSFACYYFKGAAGFTSPVWKSTPTYEIDENKYPAARWLIGLNYPHKTDLEQDLNGDGVELVTAYALYLNPRENLSSDVLKPQFTAESTSFIFKPVRTGFTYTVMYSNDLSNWSSDGVTYEFIPIDGFRAVIRNPSFPQFFCIEVTQD